MQRILGRISVLMLGLMLLYVGTVRADRDAPVEKGSTPELQTADESREDYDPMMRYMYGMMRHMRGMMSGMQGIMGSYGQLSEEEDDDDDMPWGCMMGPGMMGPGMMYGTPGRMGHYGRGHGRHHMLRWMERLTADLDLSEQQEGKIRARLRAHMKQAIQIRAELAAQRIDLQERLEAEPVDMAQVKTLLNQMATRRADLHFSHLSLMQEIKQLLTPEQQKKFNARRGYMMHGYMGKGLGDWRERAPRHRYGHEMGDGRGMRRGMGAGMGMRNP